MIVDLLPTDDQAMIADAVTAFFADRLPVGRLREPRYHGGGAEAELFGDLAGLGLFGLGVAAERGGVGYTLAEEVIVAMRMGEALVSPTVLATMLAAHAGDPAAYAAGRKACFANLLPAPRGTAAELQIIDGTGADDWLIVGDGRLFLAAAAEATPTRGMDETVTLACAPALPAGAQRPDEAGLHARFELLTAAYLSGMARAALDMAVAYVKVREQFGRPIGAFQAIKHGCADMALRVEAAHSQTCYVAALAGTGAPGSADAAAARLLATDAALANARTNIQFHGGMGFTDEADAHYYLKRSHLFATLGTNRYRLQAAIMAAPR